MINVTLNTIGRRLPQAMTGLGLVLAIVTTATAAKAAPAMGPGHQPGAGAAVLTGSQLELLNELVADHPDDLAGVMLDSAHRRVTIRFTAGGESAARKLVGGMARARTTGLPLAPAIAAPSARRSASSSRPATVAADGPWTVTFTAVRHSMRELDSVRARIDLAEPWATLAGPDLAEWYVDVERNVVAVGVTRLTPELRAAAVKTFGSLVTLYETTRTDPFFSSRQDDFEPWVAGSRISSPISSGCTTGYVVRNVFSNQTGLVTAGHCARLGDTVFNNGDPIGTVLYRTYVNNGADFAMIGGRTYEPWLYTGAWNSQTGEAIRGGHHAVIGDLLCFDGSYTGENCSARVDAQNLCLRMNTGITTCGLNRARSTNNTRLGQNGDSGGPVYGINNGVKMSGIIITGSSDGLTGYFQNVLVPGGLFVPPGWQLAYVP